MKFWILMPLAGAVMGAGLLNALASLSVLLFGAETVLAFAQSVGATLFLAIWGALLGAPAGAILLYSVDSAVTDGFDAGYELGQKHAAEQRNG